MSAALLFIGVLLAALVVDAVVGEYPHKIHPVVWMGKLIETLVELAPGKESSRQFAYGVAMTIVVVATSVVAAGLVMKLAAPVQVVQIMLGIFFLKGSLALRELTQAARRVRRAVEKGALEDARHHLRSLCSRDASSLTEEELLGAAVQSLAENTSDSFVAPVFYYALLHVPGAIAYRAVNTLDSMVGYRGDYEQLGKAAARTDDVVNWLPARLTAYLLLAAGWLRRKDVGHARAVLMRDGDNTPSPNGGRPMAVMAGLLDVQLIKRDTYTLGDPIRPITSATVDEACNLVNLAAWLALAGAAALIVFMELPG
ncbi:MAG: cobalamin biosynthesis protein [Gemmataceae bacterium]